MTNYSSERFKSRRVNSRLLTSKVERRFLVRSTGGGSDNISVLVTWRITSHAGSSMILFTPPSLYKKWRHRITGKKHGYIPQTLKPLIMLFEHLSIPFCHAVDTIVIVIASFLVIVVNALCIMWSWITHFNTGLKGLNTATSSGCTRWVAFGGSNTKIIFNCTAKKIMSSL